MNKYIALLRGINVSGQKIIKMLDLKKSLEKLPFSQITTYIQSGNICFLSKEKALVSVEMDIHEKIKKDFGYEVTVIVKTAEEIERIIAKNPFNNNNDFKKLYITFLKEVPDADLLQNVKDYDNSSETFYLKDDVIYTMYHEGYGKSKFSNNFIEKKLNIQATTRNWNTVNKLAKIASSFIIK